MATLLEKMTRRMRNALNFGDSEPFDFEWEERRDQYDEWESLYDNRIYDDQINGGQHDTILSDLLGIQCADEVSIHGFFNPVESIVDCYNGVFEGKWGEQIRVAEKTGGKDVNDDIIDPLGLIWKWSNLSTEKQNLCTMAAKLGTVGLRIGATDNPNPLKRKVRIFPEHPRTIIDFDADASGNVTDVLLEYKVLRGPLGEERKYGLYRERLTKDYFQQYQKRGTKSWEPIGDRVPNELGVCPYVILRHRGEKEYGVPAFNGSIEIIHLINWIVSMQHTGITKTIYGKWLLSGSGPEPKVIAINDLESILYAQRTSNEDPEPKMQHILAQLDHQRIVEVWKLLIALLKERQPELALNDLEVRSQQSGESIAQLMKPAEHRINLARDQYEHSLIRAMQIGVSWGILYSMWDVGTGVGSARVADEAYETGLEDFEFAPRAVLPVTVYDRREEIEVDNLDRKLRIEDAAASEGFTSVRERLRIAGYEDGEIARIMRERSVEDVVTEEVTETVTAA